MVYPNPLYEMTGPLLPSGCFPIILDKEPCDIQYLLAGLDGRKEVCDPRLHPAIPADIDLPSGLDPHDSDILDPCLSAVPRTAGNRHLDLCRTWDPLIEMFHLNPEGDGILDTEAAEGLAHTGLAGPDGLCIGMARGHPKFCPHRWKEIPWNPQEVYPLSPCNLDHGDAVSLCHAGNLP